MRKIFLVLTLLFFLPVNSFSQEEDSRFSVYGIPLGSTIQETSDILQQKGIGIDDGAKEFTEFVVGRSKETVVNQYKIWNLDSKNLEKEFEQKFKPVLFKYNNKQYFLDPLYFYYFIENSPDKTYPLFETDYYLYNSYFVLYSRSFPEDMSKVGIAEMHILFASFNGAEPRSFAICIRLLPENNNTEMLSMLNKKYGKPKLCWGLREDFTVSGSNPDDVWKTRTDSVIKYLKDNDLVASITQQSAKKPTYGTNVELLFPTPTAYSKPSDPFYIGNTYYDFCTTWNFEWISNDIKILSQFSVVQNFFEEVGVRLNCVTNGLYPETIAYVYQPYFERLLKMASDFKIKSESMISKARQSGLGQF